MTDQKTFSEQFSFIHTLISDALVQAHMFDGMDEAQVQGYTTQFMVLAVERIGIDCLSALPADKHAQFALLAKNPDMTPQMWHAFWTESVPKFDAVVRRSIDAFIHDLKISAVRSSIS